jgi:hypothetical protein
MLLMEKLTFSDSGKKCRRPTLVLIGDGSRAKGGDPDELVHVAEQGISGAVAHLGVLNVSTVSTVFGRLVNQPHGHRLRVMRRRVEGGALSAGLAGD